MNQYDAIFREILNDERSEAVRFLTGLKAAYSVRPTHAGWRTGRSVDFLAEIRRTQHVHIEIQSTNDPTMHWRMLNYYVLLSHRLHEWKKDDFAIDQYMFYVGSDSFTMKRGNPNVGEPYRFAAENIESMDLSEGMESSYYGDWVLALFGKDIVLGDWISTFDRICTLQDENDRLSGLFFLDRLAPLREAEHMISERLSRMDLAEAIETSPVTGRLAERVTAKRSIELLNIYLNNRGRALLNDEERLILETIPGNEAWELATMIAINGTEREAIIDRGRTLDLI